jgi:hypothetical protein
MIIIFLYSYETSSYKVGGCYCKEGEDKLITLFCKIYVKRNNGIVK